VNGALALPVAVPLLAAAVLLLVRSPVLQRTVALGTTLGVFVAGCLLVVATGREVLVTQIAGWPPGVAIPFVADPLAALMVSVSALLVLVCGVFAAVTETDRGPYFWPLVLVLSAGVYGAYLTGDLFNFFVFVEVLLLPSYVLLTLTNDRAQVGAARVYVTVNLFASTLLILGVGLVYGAAGTVNLGELAGRGDEPAVAAGAAVVAIALAVKAALVPAHGWLPRTYPHASPAVVALFSGLLTKVGVYALLRIYTVVFDSDPAYRWLIVAVAVTSMVVGVLGAVGQSDMRSILTFHMVSQTGYIVFGIALATPFGVAAMLYYLLQYVLVKTGLFLAAGAVVAGYGTDRLDRVGGLARREPVLAASFVVAAFSLVGFPPFAGFVAKLALVVAALREQQYVGAVAVIAVSVLTLTSMLKIWNAVFWGPRAESSPRVRPAVAAPVAVLAATSLVLGVAAQGLLGLGEDAATVLLEPLRYAEAVVGS
jgi:multicomponent Na+:H+ antiporter subunit D